MGGDHRATRTTGRIFIRWAMVQREIFLVDDSRVVVRDVVVREPMRRSHPDSLEVLEIPADQGARGVANGAVASVGIHD